MSFTPQFTDLSDTKRVKDRTTINESMAGRVGGKPKKCVALVPLEGSKDYADKEVVANLTMDTVLAGFGVVAWNMLAAFFKENPAADLTGIAVAEAAGTAADGSILWNAAAGKDGTITIKASDQPETWVSVELTEGDLAAAIATAVDTALKANAHFPHTPTIVTSTTTKLTCKYKGEIGNWFRIELVCDDDMFATAPTITQFTNGATDPTINSDYTDLYKGVNYDCVLCPFVADDDDIEHLEDVAAYMAHGERGRGALHFLGVRDTYANLVTFASARNRKDFCLLGQISSESWLTPPHHRAAIEMGVVSAETNPSVPFLKETRERVLQGDEWSRPNSYDASIELCLAHGITIDDVDPDSGETVVEAVISTKTKLDGGVDTVVYESIHVFFVEKFMRAAIVADLATAYSSRELRKMTDGKLGDVKGRVLNVLYLYAKKPYEYLSLSALEANKDQVVAQVDPDNSKRLQIGVPNPVIQDYRGTDTELFTIQP